MNQPINLETIETYTGKLKREEKKRVQELLSKKQSIGQILNDIQQKRTTSIPNKIKK